MKPLSLKNRVWVNVHKGSWDFGKKFWVEKCSAQFAFGFGCTEPRPDYVQNRVSLAPLSRWKGIETQHLILQTPRQCRTLWLRFPVGRESKPFLSSLKVKLTNISLDTLSRWKGIETHIYTSKHLHNSLWIRFPVGRESKRLNVASRCLDQLFGSAFPLEGNRNPSLVLIYSSHPTLAPLSRWKGIETCMICRTESSFCGLWLRFPVGRESKHMFGRSCIKSSRPLAPLSRWKGIETYRRYPHGQDQGFFLWIRFPVRRESKHRRVSATSPEDGVFCL